MDKAYKVLLLLAGPAYIWTAFEMYILSLMGSQMLFFSVAHSAPIFLVFLLISGALYLALLLTNIYYVAFSDNPAIERKPIIVLIASQMLHIAFLFSYENWGSSEFCIPVCLLGLYILAHGGYYVLSHVFALNKHRHMDKTLTSSCFSSAV